MIFRKRTYGVRHKWNLKLFSLHRIIHSKYRTIIQDCVVTEFLCPRIRNFDWKYENSRGENIEKWLRENVKTSYSIKGWITPRTGTKMDYHATVEVVFCNRNDALLFKLQMG